MRHRRSSCLLSCLLLSTLAGCGESLDRAAQHEHELIDHEYDRKDQLVERIFVLVNETLDNHQEHQLDVFDRLIDAELELLSTMIELAPPPDFRGPTCSFTSEPSDAEVFARNVFDEWEFVGRTPLVVERPAFRAEAIEVRAQGHAPASGYMLSERVHGPCQDHFVLTRVSSI